VAIASGTTPRMNAKDVIRIGAAGCAPPARRHRTGSAFILALARELDDQDRVLGGEPDEHHEPDLRQDVDVHPAQQQTVTAASRHIGTIRHRQRQLQLCTSRQYEKDKDDRGAEDEQAGVAGKLLLVGEIGPLEAEAVGSRSAASFSIAARAAGGVARQGTP
jgi:hypothetical protein